MALLTLKNPVENCLTIFSVLSIKDKAKHTSKLSWSLSIEVYKIGIPDKWIISFKKWVWNTATSNLWSVCFLSNNPGVLPRCPPSDWTGLHGSWTIEKKPLLLLFIDKLPSTVSVLAMPSLAKPNW